MEQSTDSTFDMAAIVSTVCQNEINGSSASLLILNDHCLLEIAKHLNLWDTINLSKACRRLKNLAETFMFKKFSEFTIKNGMYCDDDGEKVIYKDLSHIGPHVKKLKCSLRMLKLKHFWMIINRTCKQLKHIEIEQWKEKTAQNFLEFTCFENVESIDLHLCRFHPNSSFLSSFRNLTQLSSHNAMKFSELAMVFRKNPNLASCQFVPVSTGIFMNNPFIEFNVNSKHPIPPLHSVFFPNVIDMYREIDEEMNEMDLRCFDLVPKLEELSIDVPHVESYPILAKMKLKTFDVYCSNDRLINQLLIQLDEHECMEKLTLRQVDMNVQSMNILKSKFTKLRYLHIDCEDDDFHYHYLPTLPIGWPKNLTELILNGVMVSFDMFLATLRHLKRLENFSLRWSYCANENDEEKFYNVESIQQEILKATSYEHKLTVVLPMAVHRSSSKITLQVL